MTVKVITAYGLMETSYTQAHFQYIEIHIHIFMYFHQ